MEQTSPRNRKEKATVYRARASGGAYYGIGGVVLIESGRWDEIRNSTADSESWTAGSKEIHQHSEGVLALLEASAQNAG